MFFSPFISSISLISSNFSALPPSLSIPFLLFYFLLLSSFLCLSHGHFSHSLYVGLCSSLSQSSHHDFFPTFVSFSANLLLIFPHYLPSFLSFLSFSPASYSSLLFLFIIFFYPSLSLSLPPSLLPLSLPPSLSLLRAVTKLYENTTPHH